MLFEWATIGPIVIPFLKNFADDISSKLAAKSADGLIGQIEHRVFSEGILIRANEAFCTRFIKELDSSIDLPTLTAKPYELALQSFLCNPNVQYAISIPLDGESTLDPDLLRAIWKESYLPIGELLIGLPADFNWKKVANTYQQAIRNLMLANPDFRQVLAVLAAEKVAASLIHITGPLPRFDLARYAKAIEQAYSYLTLGTFDSDWTEYVNRVRLEYIYVPQSAKHALPPRDITRDYLQILKQQGLHLHLNFLSSPDQEILRQTSQYESLIPVPLMNVIDDPQQRLLVILGDPGLGKSTLLKHLALRWAQKRTLPLTLLFELRYVSRDFPKESFLCYLEKSNHPCFPLPQVELHEYLATSESLLLFDGLDEVPAQQRDETVKKLIRISQQYAKARVVVTTRINGYHPDSRHPELFTDAGFEQFTLQDFQEREIDTFVRLWHKEAYARADEREVYEKRLRKAIEDSLAISELATNPLLLTMMAILSRSQDLPRDRVRLYRSCAELLLKNWDLEKFPELAERSDTRDIRDKLGPQQKMRILEQVAAAMQRERTGLSGNLIEHSKLADVIGNELQQLGVPQAWAVTEDLIAMLRERNFMLAYLGGEQFAFVHRTFLEYFVARDLRYQLEKTSALHIDKLEDLFRKNWNRTEWQEILRLLCGLIGAEYAGRCTSQLLSLNGEEGPQAILLAAECLQEVRELGLIREQRAATRAALLSLVHLEIRPELDLRRRRVFLHSRAVQLFAEGWRNEPETALLIKEFATSSKNDDVRAAALHELTRFWKDKVDTHQFIKDRIISDESSYIRGLAIAQLARTWKHDPETLVILQRHAAEDEDSSVRAVAIRELAEGWPNTPGTLSALEECANDYAYAVRRVAIELLLLNWKDNSTTLAILKDHALHDEVYLIRMRALGGLSRQWKNDPDTLPLLKKLASADRDSNIQAVAVEELVRGWKDDPDTLRILKECASGDKGEYLQKFAMRELGLA